MILQALYELAEQEELMGDPDYVFKPVAWLVRLDEDGRLLGIEGTHIVPETQGKRKPKPRAKNMLIPRQPLGRAGTKAPPAFFVDNSKYVFGLPAKDKTFSEEEGREKSGWFRQMIARCVETTDDDGARGVLAFLEDLAAGRQRVDLPESCLSNELFAFVYGPDVDRLVHNRPKVRAYWKRQRQAPTHAPGSMSRCLVSGKPVGEIGLFPLLKNVPGKGTSSGVALVSFNKNAFESYGWGRNENAPISREAAEACATALNRLLHPAFPDPRPEQLGQTLPRRHLRLSADTLVCYWTAGRGSEEFLDQFALLLDAADPGQVSDLYRSLWKGHKIELDDPAAFYALTLTGSQGRAIIRDWFEASVAEVANNLAQHFADLEITRNTPSPSGKQLSPQVPLRALLGCLAPLGKRDQIPAPLAGQFIHAALRGTPYPFSVLQRALERMRAEIGRTEWADLERRDARAALIKAVLNRRRRFHPKTSHYEEITVTMDPSNTNPGYLLGRLMAVIERLQQEALRDLNASVIDRYFSAASASPRSVFTRLLKNARHHARKAKDDPGSAGTARWLEGLIDEISFSFDPKQNGFPAHLDLQQQGLFVLGYHHQRHWLWMSREDREQWERQQSAHAPQ